MTFRSAAAICMLMVLMGCQGEQPDSATVLANDIRDAPASDRSARFDTPPVLVEYVAPEYPEEAREQGIEGNVDVKIVVGTDGRVEDASVLGGAGQPVLEEAALESARECRFKPATLAGDAVRCTVVLPIRFALGATLRSQDSKQDDTG